MVGMTTACANNFLKLLFQAVAWGNIADNTATSPITNVYASAHTADPGAAGIQTTSETSYTSYARQATVRSSSGFTVSTNTVYPIANIVFPVSTSGTPTLTHLGWGSAVSGGSGQLFFTGAINPNIVVSTSVVQTVAGGASGSVITIA